MYGAYALIGDSRPCCLTLSVSRLHAVTAPLEQAPAVCGRRLLAGAACAVSNQGALDGQNVRRIEDQEVALADILRCLIVEGYRIISPLQMRMEMALMIHAQEGRERVGDILSWHKPEWIRRVACEIGAVEYNSTPRILRAAGTRYQVRTYTLKPEFVRDALAAAPEPHQAEVAPLAFCNATRGACASCAYRQVGCPILPHRPDRTVPN